MPKPAVPIDAWVAAPSAAQCVTQGLTIRTKPGDHVFYSTEYADKSNEHTPNRHYTAGFGSAVADANGVVHLSWDVPMDAPLGPATIHYIAQGQSDATYVVRFTVTAGHVSNGQCTTM